MKQDRQEYDPKKLANASTGAVLRVVVALYVGWLGVKLLRGMKEGGTTVPPALGWTVGILFIAAALAFCFYIWKRWQADRKAARSSPEQETESPGPQDPDTNT